jgi:hypothetical protein
VMVVDLSFLGHRGVDVMAGALSALGHQAHARGSVGGWCCCIVSRWRGITVAGVGRQEF